MEDWTGDLGLELGDELTWDPMRIVEPDPWVGHLPFAFWIIKALKPQTLVELGTHSANSYFAFCQAMAIVAPAGRAYAVDTWQGDEHAGFYEDAVHADVAAFNSRHFRQFSTLMRTTFDEARSYFPDGAIDLLHIDGMHSYESVRHDFENWESALSERAVVLFHDTNVRERGFGVWRLWRELSERFPFFEFGHSNGLGVLGVGPHQAPQLRALFALEQLSEGAASFRSRISSRGEAFQRQVQVISLASQVSTKDAHIEDLTNQIQSLAQQNNALAQHIEAVSRDAHEARAEIQKNQDLAQRVEALAREDDRNRSEIGWRDALLAARLDVIHAKDAILASIENTSAARAAALYTRDTLLLARDGALSQMLNDLQEQRRSFGEQLHKAVLDREAARLEALQAKSDAEMSLERHHTELVNSYVNSTSWRLTRPVRLLARVLKRRGSAAASPLSVAPTPAAVPTPAALPPETTGNAELAATPDLLKSALRAMQRAKLQAFLAGSENLRLPSADHPAVSIILVLYNQAELTFACLASIVETLGAGAPGIEVVIVDNNSSDLTSALLNRVENATILRNPANLHFLKAVNQAAKAARGKNLLLLNNDAQLSPGAVAAALRTLESDATIGAVGGRIILLDGTLQEAGSIIWQDGACSGYGRGEEPSLPDFMFQRDVDYCSGAFLLTPLALFHELGGFDERFAPAYYEETDYCVRLWEHGYRVVYDPDAVIVHFEFGSSNSSADALALQAANHAIFVAQHRDWLDGQWPASPANVLAARTARSNAPRVLVLEDRIPKIELGTGYPRANRFVHELIAAGAQVAFFPMFRFAETWHGVRKALDKRIEVLIAAEGPQIRDYLVARRNHFDAIFICRPQNMETFQKAIGFEQELIGNTAIIYDAEALFVTRTLQKLKAEGKPASEIDKHRMIATEVSLTRKAQAVISVAVAEQQTLEDYGAQNVHLLGHALEDEPLETAFEDRDQIVFLGAIQADDAPNADAVRWFTADILPRIRQSLGESFRLTVIGQNKADSISALNGSALDLMGMVDDLRPALARARVLVVPTRFAAGIPHKVHQAAMLGIPMVVTTLIAGQLGWENGAQFLVASEADAFADACIRLYRDKSLWESVRSQALQQAQEECSPETFSARVRSILAEVPVVRRQPPGGHRIEPAPAPISPPEPHTSRPARADYSLAVPFGFTPLASQPRIAAICHFYHVDVAGEALFYLNHLPSPADLYVTTDCVQKRDRLQQIVGGWDKGSFEIKVVPNRGRDIAPKLIAFAEQYGNYDLVLHLHSKKSAHAAFLAPWRSFLYENLLGSKEIVASIFDAFERLPDLGMVAPQHYEGVRRWLGWNGNFEIGKSLASRMGISLSPQRALDFPSGSMFWARPAALKPLLDLKLSYDDFPTEDEQVDHTLAHAIERLYFHICERSGHTWLKIAQPSLYWDTSTIVEVPTPAALSQFAAEHGIMLTGPAAIACRDDPAPMQTKVPPGLALRLASRGF